MGPAWSPDRDQRPEAASTKPEDTRIRKQQARTAERQATSSTHLKDIIFYESKRRQKNNRLNDQDQKNAWAILQPPRLGMHNRQKIT